MTAYDDMPVGTVLRGSNGLVWVKRYANGWCRDGSTGSLATHLLVLTHSPLVELVEKPAEPTAPAKLLDREGDVWSLGDDGLYRLYPREGDPMTRAELDEIYGPLAEMTP